VSTFLGAVHLYNKLNQLDSALFYYKESISLYDSLGSLSFIAENLNSIGEVQINKANTKMLKTPC
jgi:hypothetical protein